MISSPPPTPTTDAMMTVPFEPLELVVPVGVGVPVVPLKLGVPVGVVVKVPVGSSV